MNKHEKVFVWNTSIDLAVRMIALADRLAARRRFAIADQLTRAALSVPSNIAEGQGRLTTRDRRHYLVQARASLYELETQLEVITRAGLAKDVSGARGTIRQISAGLSRMIANLGKNASATRSPGNSATPTPSSS